MTPKCDEKDSFVVVFFRNASGELRCRVTEVVTRQAWIVQHAQEIRLLLTQRHTETGEGPLRGEEASPT
jgi:hypothetical protein